MAQTPSKDQFTNLIWSDEFEGDFIDTTKWKFETGDHGWGNNEWQDYQPQGSDNVEIKDGTLRITARKTGPGQRVGDYTSARINSRESFLYGRIEIRAKMPEYKGPGIWPALWMLGENMGELGWPLCGEIDLMEYISSSPNSVLMTIHSQANNHMNGTQLSSGFVPLPNIEEEFEQIKLQLMALSNNMNAMDGTIKNGMPEDDEDELRLLWDNNIHKLKQAIGG